MKPIRGGLKLDGKKDTTAVSWTIARPSPPRRVRIPLSFASDITALPTVRVGESVRVGEKIAETKSRNSVTLHASISGKISEIAKFPHPLLGESESVEILSDNKDESLPEIGHERSGWELLSSSEIQRILGESGIPWNQPSSPIDTLIVNGCESEPYLTSDHSLLMSHPVEILKGCEIFFRLLGARNLVIVLEDNKEEVAELLKSKIFFNTWSHARVEVLPSRYPQGHETVLVGSLLKKPIQPGHSVWEVGVVVQNVTNVYAAYEAVVIQKPFYERVLTIAGECVAQPRNVWVRIGTLVEDVVKYARGFLRPPEKVVLGGPMTGVALGTLDIPVLGESRAILGLPKEVVRLDSIEPCIRCGRCVESCPVSISPVMITLAAEKDLFEVAQDYGAPFCIECGNCSYICPSKRPMVELIQYANAHS